MFIVLSKTYLVLNEAEVHLQEGQQSTSNCVVFNLKATDTTEPATIAWPPAIIASSGDNNKSKQSGRVICGCISPSEDLIALCDDNKNLVIFNRQLEAIRHYVVKRNCVKILFKRNEEAILGCDKSGDIYEFALSENSDQQQQGEKMLLGHCSMLLDFTLTPDNRYVISCDRDEKIRVTHYPNTYNVQSYCLGHEEFVSAVELLDSTTLVSASGDGKVILWDFVQGKKLFSFDCEQKTADNKASYNGSAKKEKSQFPIRGITTDSATASHLAVSFYKQSVVFVFKVVRNDAGSASSLELWEKLPFDTEPIWIQFDKAHSNFLWVLGGTKTASVELFELKQDTVGKAFSTLKVVERLNQSPQLTAAIEKERQENPLEGLLKHWFNNLEVYFERKKLRIEGEQNKAKRSIW